MPAWPKCFIHGTTILVTFRTEEGLPLVASPVMRFILLGILAAAQSTYPVKICHFIVMGNHVHLLLVIDNPRNIADFVGYFKRESSHAINNLLGREKRTVWIRGYDSPPILDAAKAFETIAYIYTNPARANLVQSVEDYPNLSSWRSFRAGGSESSYKRIPREAIPKLPKNGYTRNQEQELIRLLLLEASEEHSLVIEPDAWMRCFPETCDTDPDVMTNNIIAHVQRLESALSMKRNDKVLGSETLLSQDLRKPHNPDKHSRRMMCLSTERQLRVQFIVWFKELVINARKLRRSLTPTEWLKHLPPGFFPPGGRPYANLIPDFTPCFNAFAR